MACNLLLQFLWREAFLKCRDFTISGQTSGVFGRNGDKHVAAVDGDADDDVSDGGGCRHRGREGGLVRRDFFGRAGQREHRRPHRLPQRHASGNENCQNMASRISSLMVSHMASHASHLSISYLSISGPLRF